MHLRHKTQQDCMSDMTDTTTIYACACKRSSTHNTRENMMGRVEGKGESEHIWSTAPGCCAGPGTASKSLPEAPG
eukprot:11676874-Alexandrium_andersonii.AAC.1